ncbi:MAG TPA: hypothetical protein VHS96_13350 [Bacteroidia bacterium]|nr:hypothetical protein [Bacteroidia bacterium]
MPLSAELQALTLPSGTEFPGTPQELLELIAQYMAITGLSPFNGINYGDTEPAADERDRPWFKTDGSGNPIGWYSWNGLAWTPSPVEIESGTTSQRPASPNTGRLYYDTDIMVELIFNGTSWVTAAGSPGDVKEVKATDLTEALLRNPGWSHDTDSVGQVIGGASDGSSYSYDSEVGGDEVMLEESDLPDVAIPLQSGWYPYSGQHQNGAQPAGVYPIVTGQVATAETQSMNSGVQTGIDVRQPTRYYWRIVKD